VDDNHSSTVYSELQIAVRLDPRLIEGIGLLNVTKADLALDSNHESMHMNRVF